MGVRELECASQGERNGWRGTEGERKVERVTMPTSYRRQDNTKMAPAGKSVKK